MNLSYSNRDVKDLLMEVQDVFCMTEKFLESTDDENEIKRYLESLDKHFYPVAIEALSYFFTQRELPQGNEMPHWNKWFDYISCDLQLFLFVGFGMAVARMDKQDMVINKIRKHPMSDMIYDGIGYHDALFNARKIIKAHLTNDRIPKDKMNLYDQGIGRRIWYYANGNMDSALEIISSFPQNRQKSLMRGFGIAFAFVESLQEMDGKEWKMEFRQSFLTGMIMAAEIRSKTFDFSNALKNIILYLAGMDEQRLNNVIKFEISGLSAMEQIDRIEKSLIQINKNEHHV